MIISEKTTDKPYINRKLFLTTKEASYRYGYSRYWFERKRWDGSGPLYKKISSTGRVLYPIEQTDKWFDSFGLRSSTHDT